VRFSVNRKWRLILAGFLFLIGISLVSVTWTTSHCPRRPYDTTRLQLASLEMKIQAYWLDTHQWPRTLQALLTDDRTPGWQGPYARATDLKDVWGGDVQYDTGSDAAPILSARSRKKQTETREIERPNAR